MRDKARNYPLGSGLKMPALHGHTTIILHNHKTGFRERIEHDNTFTDGITKYLLSSGYFNNSPWRNDTWRNYGYARSLLGGILLFDSEIEDDDGVYPTIMPAGVKMVANGAYGVSNNGSVTELGSYNNQESSISSAGYTFVYDWTTSQGNGEIASLSLTSELGGFIGYGNSTSQASMATSDTRSINTQQDTNTLGFSGNRKSYCIQGDTVFYALTDCESATQLVYYSMPVGIDSELSVFRYAEQHTVDLPNSVKGNGYRYVISADRGLAVVLLPENSFWRNSAGARPLAIYNITTETWEEHTARSEYDEQIGSIHASSIHDDIICIGGHYTPGSCVTRLDTHEVVAPVTVGSSVFYRISPDLYLRGVDNYYLRIIDDVNGTNYPTNGDVKLLYGNNVDAIIGTVSMSDNRQFCTVGGKGIKVYRNPLYLATVNNLEESVTKTSAMSMKVTYTVTPATE